MVSPPVRLLGLLVPVLVIPLGLLALKVLGIVAIFKTGRDRIIFRTPTKLELNNRSPKTWVEIL